MVNLYLKAVPPPDMNRNTEWFMYPGVWTTYVLILFFGWLLVLSVSGCSPGMAWTVVNLAHFVEISRTLRLAGYKADTSHVMLNIDKEGKEDALCLHSEKAAIAFCIMCLKEDVSIRIVKNLRVCSDCISFL